MAYKNIEFTKEDSIGILTINRPKALNALNTETVTELNDCVGKIENDPEVKVLIITGSGKKSFVAGADIVEMSTKNPIEGRHFGKISQDTFTRIENLPQPVIAAVNGFALGGGCELACACDFRYASENAKFGQPEVGLGITPGFGGTQRLPRVVGRGYGKELIYRANMINAQEAHRIGLVNTVVPQEELMDTCLKVAKEIASNAKIAVQLAKTAINRGINCDVITGIAYEDEVFGLCFSTDDQKEGMAAFVEKREKHFTDK
ncbi:crotonase [Megasphaera cerevisiae DSM 20462]|jgi:enoyl-CoA hydratase|uniref:Crotonase n=1 Tax=Megasphaera cerevisiae DSM 20462 TaxID=1122219 RepID=A0A0J6WVT7_9FIRM|nr:short-chain-enoyl-CoA hydratase [Megasphaera cerevisiae]KMO87625.1 crotonase [Megasphaera cerevisiae DSM 20462]SJZ66902.1 enoyl-CoA hydratase [Megasphaera cerevisiae DSM 20462]